MKDAMDLPKGIYQHYKGNRYEVIDVARHSETEEWHVLYRALYGEKDLWVRPLSMFTEDVKVDESNVKRFQRVRNYHEPS